MCRLHYVNTFSHTAGHDVFPFYMEAHTFVHDVQNEIHVPVFIYLLLKIHKYKSNKTRCSLVYATGQNN